MAAPAASALPLPRLLVVLAHPDDEVLALGARLERLTHSKLLTLTDGAPADGEDARQHGFATLAAYRDARQQELRCAFADAGLSLATLLPDTSPAPIPVADQTAALHLAALTRAVAQVIATFAPEAVLTHPYEGGHPDHDACAFVVHTALRLLGATSSAPTPRPVLLEAPSYHAGDDGTLRSGTFLDKGDASPPVIRELSPDEQTRKQARLACFRSQAETLAQFGTQRELFRVAPAYDFTEPPHNGQLLYEHFSWGMTGERFRSLAQIAREELFAPAGPSR